MVYCGFVSLSPLPFRGLKRQRRVLENRSRRRNQQIHTVTAILGNKLQLDACTVNWDVPVSEGSYGSVFFGTDTRSGDQIVVKCPKDVPLATKLLDTERYVNQKLSYVDGRWAEYLGSHTLPFDADIPRGILRNCLVWKMEGDGSTLDDFLTKKPMTMLAQAFNVSENPREKRSVATCKAVIRELLCAVAEMHETGIMHRDVKPSNIIIAPGNRYPLRIIDFGSACDWKTPLKRGLNTNTCDPVYSAPELRISLLNPEKFDVFSVGLIAMQILFPSLHEGYMIKDFKYRLEQCDYDLVRWCAELLDRPYACATVTEVEELYDDAVLLPVLAQMLRREPKQRPSSVGVLRSGAFGEVDFA